MARDGIEVTNLRETIRDLERMGVEVEDLKEAFGQISRQVVAKASAIVPRSTGRLAASIKPSKTKNRAIVRAGSPAAVPYAGVINYGWPARGIAPTEFLTGPANANPEDFARQIDANLRDLIRRYDLA